MKRRNFNRTFSQATPEGIDLLQQMLRFDPNKRIGVDKALGHSFFSAYHNIEEEIPCEIPFDHKYEQFIDQSGDYLKGNSYLIITLKITVFKWRIILHFLTLFFCLQNLKKFFIMLSYCLYWICLELSERSV